MIDFDQTKWVNIFTAKGSGDGIQKFVFLKNNFTEV